MPRPCLAHHPEPKAAPGAYRPGDCRTCWLELNDDRYRRAWSSGAPPTPPPVPLPCVHVGPPVRGPSAPDPVRDYYECEAGRGVVCRCRCGPACPAYEADG